MIEAYTYNRCLSFLHLFCLILLLPLTTQAQFIDLQLNIETKLEARTEKPLDFGILQSETGRRTVELGSPGMGVFSITAMENQLLFVSLDLPEVLYHENPAVSDVIPFELYVRYGFSADRPRDSFTFRNGFSSIQVEESDNPGPWSRIYLFIFGSIDIRDVPEGLYSNEIVLNVEYI